MKKRLTTLLLIALCLSLMGCTYEQAERKPYKISPSETIYVDEENGVMYFWRSGTKKGGLSVMLNPDGSAKTYDKENSIYQNVHSISPSETIYVDEENGVMYFWRSGTKKGGLSVMLNPDGSAKTYDKENSIYQNVHSISPSETIYIDEENGVMYFWKSGINKGGLSVMLNPDGSAKTYDKENSIYQNIANISSQTIYVDEENGVMYFWRSGTKKGDLSVMLNPDGSAKTYDKENNIYQNVYPISYQTIYIDEENGVMYFWRSGTEKGGLSVMFHPDGSAKTYCIEETTP